MSEQLVAPEGQVWVCGACGKTARHRYGHGYGLECSLGWDESCMLHAVLCYEQEQSPPDPMNWKAVSSDE